MDPNSYPQPEQPHSPFPNDPNAQNAQGPFPQAPQQPLYPQQTNQPFSTQPTPGQSPVEQPFGAAGATIPQADQIPAPQAGTELFPPNPLASMSSTPPPAKNKNMKLVIGIVIALLILVVGAVIALSGGKKNNQEASGEQTTGTQVSATNQSDFGKVCSGNTITSAASYTGTAPHPISFFEEGVVGSKSFVTSSVYLSGAGWMPKTGEFNKTQLVGCFTKKSSTGTGRKCELLDSDNKAFQIEQFNVVYSLTIYEAKSGKKVGEKEVSGPASTCPFFATYIKEDPKLYGDPDKGSVADAVKEYVTK